ncbi:MAG TPA: hypothetical protein PLF25_10255 [Accumulibacter sp.]|nr:hypothetical protein [Accumulibacter sp.]
MLASESPQLLVVEVGICRERIHPPLTTLGLFIGQVLSQAQASLDAVSRRLSEGGVCIEPKKLSYPTLFA